MESPGIYVALCTLLSVTSSQVAGWAETWRGANLSDIHFNSFDDLSCALPLLFIIAQIHGHFSKACAYHLNDPEDLSASMFDVWTGAAGLLADPCLASQYDCYAPMAMLDGISIDIQGDVHAQRCE